MTLNYVTLILNLYDGQGNPEIRGAAALVPSAVLTDAADQVIVTQDPIPGVFHASGFPQVTLLATDNAAPQPAGWTWGITFTGQEAPISPFSFFLPFTGGPVQYLSSLIPVSSGSTFRAYLPTAGGTMTGPLILAPGTSSPSLQGGSGSTEKTFDVSISSGGRPLFLKTTSTYDHALTTFLTGQQTATGGGGGGYNPTQFNNSAVNAVSENYLNSAMFLSGVETSRGTLKIAHKGYADGSDANAAGVSIDLQTDYNTPGDTTQPGGLTGTAAQGLFITSTTDAAPSGNAITVRYNTLDQFVVKSTGRVAIGNISIGHTPAGQLEIAQKDTSTFGLAMTAIASGTDMINLKDSGGAQRFQVNNSGNMITRATALISTNMQVGATSASLGGGGNGCIGVSQASTAPTTNPASNGVILYVDSSGNLLCRTSAGNVRTVAAA